MTWIKSQIILYHDDSSICSQLYRNFIYAESSSNFLDYFIARNFQSKGNYESHPIFLSSSAVIQINIFHGEVK